MSDWDEKVQRAAEALDMGAIEATEPGEVRLGFRKGARWQRKVLLSDEAVERVARELFYGDVDPDLDVSWTTAHEGVRAEYLSMARNALTAALGEEGNDE